MDVGVIGTGQMGRNHVRVYSEIKPVSSVYIYDLNEKQSGEVAKQYSVDSTKSLGDLLSKVDAVSLCVPTPFHYKTAMEIFSHGTNVLIEKPICLTVREGIDLIEKIPPGVVVGVGHIERFNPIVPEIARMISDPLYVELKRHNPTSSRITGSSVVEDLMIHDIDIVRHCLLGDDYDIFSRGTDDVATALCQFGSTPVYFSASRKASKKIRMIHIEQEDMTIEGDFMTQEIYVHKKPEQYFFDNERYIQENIVEKVQVAKKEPLKVELVKFLEAVSKGSEFPVTPWQAVENLNICERIVSGFSNV
jgi:predicted dehydrogenase